MQFQFPTLHNLSNNRLPYIVIAFGIIHSTYVDFNILFRFKYQEIQNSSFSAIAHLLRMMPTSINQYYCERVPLSLLDHPLIKGTFDKKNHTQK